MPFSKDMNSQLNQGFFFFFKFDISPVPYLKLSYHRLYQIGNYARKFKLWNEENAKLQISIMWRKNYQQKAIRKL